MGTLRDPSTINNVGTLGSATNPTTAQALPLERENQKAIRELVGTFGYEDLTISSGGITPTKAEVTVDTEAGASTDDLTTIYLVSDGTTTLHDGMILKLRAYDPARAVTVKHGSGVNQIQTVSGTDIVLDTTWDLTLKLQSGVWKEIAGKPVVDIAGNAATATDLASGSVLSVAKGGTGATSAAAALENLGALPCYLCEVYYFRHPTLRAGFVAAQGGLIANAATLYPEAWAYLQTAEGQLLCKTEAQWQAMTTATWATLADGSTVGWNGIGGAPYYVQSLVAGTLRVPDLRGMYAEAAGYDSLGVGGTHGWGMPDISGTFATAELAGNSSATGAFYAGGDALRANTGYVAGGRTYGFSSSRVVPTANKIQPRAWGALACVYLGRPAS